MGANSKIEWTDHTFNPWMGCTRVSEGCVNCYAEAMMDHRMQKVQWGPKGERIRTSRHNWAQPLKWNAWCAKHNIRQRVFCASLADIFDDHPSILPEWRADLWKLIAETPHLDWLLLTKRPQNWPAYLPTIEPRLMFSSIRLGVTIENDAARKARAHILALASNLGWPTFISYEPALGPVDWSFLKDLSSPVYGGGGPRSGGGGASEASDTWLIAGGESGPAARPPHPDWFRAARDAAAAAHIPFFFKQWGEWAAVYDRDIEDPDWRRCDAVKLETPKGRWCNLTGGHGFHGERVIRVDRFGKKAAGRLLDGVEHSAFPPSTSASRTSGAAARSGTHPNT